MTITDEAREMIPCERSHGWWTCCADGLCDDCIVITAALDVVDAAEKMRDCGRGHAYNCPAHMGPATKCDCSVQLYWERLCKALARFKEVAGE